MQMSSPSSWLNSSTLKHYSCTKNAANSVWALSAVDAPLKLTFIFSHNAWVGPDQVLFMECTEVYD